jgi:hypothetical protein
MISWMLPRFLILLAATLLVASVDATTAPPPLQQPPRIVAVGDVHGAFEDFVGILQTAGVIDAKRAWSGGTTILVQTGDVFDRGPGVRDALDLLMRLEGEARRAGGRVEALLGNHEMMNILSEFKDVAPGGFAAFADARSENRRRRAYDDYARLARQRGSTAKPAQSQAEWMTAHPPGFIEYVEALGPRGKYGRWLRARKVITTVSGSAFMHAGVHPDWSGSLDDVNRTAASDVISWDRARDMMVQARLVPEFCTLDEAIEAAAVEVQRIAEALKTGAPPGDHVTREFVERIQALLQIGKSSLLDPDGPLWFRGYAQWPDTDEPKMAALVQRFGVQRFVTGHTPSLPGRVRMRFGGRSFLIDTGMLSTFFKGGRASALEIQDGRITAIYTDAREVLQPPAGAYLVPAPFFRGAALSAARAATAASAAVRY